MITLYFSPTTIFKKYTEKQAPPLSIAYLAQFLQSKGYEVTSINPNNFLVMNLSTDKKEIEKFMLDKSIKEIEHTQPKYLVVSTWTYGMPFTIELIKRFKQRNPDVPVILGGRNATFLPEQTLMLTKADYIVRGEGQIALFELINKLDKLALGNQLRSILKDNEKIDKKFENEPNNHGKLNLKNKINELNKIIKFDKKDFQKRIITNTKTIDLNSLPLLDFSSFDTKGLKDIYLMSSLGCMHRCRFCSDTALWDKYRSFSPEYMGKQVKLLQKLFGDVFVTFWDSNFTMQPEFGKKFASLVSDLRWACYSRIDDVSRSILKPLSASGLRWMYFGIESLNPETLLWFNKTKEPAAYIKNTFNNLKLLQDLNIDAICSYILGSPVEDKKTLLMNKKHISGLKQYSDVEISLLTLELKSPLWFEHQNGNVDMFKAHHDLESFGYAGTQLFSEKYEDLTLTPQKFFFRNKFIEDKEFEDLVLDLR